MQAEQSGCPLWISCTHSVRQKGVGASSPGHDKGMGTARVGHGRGVAAACNQA